METKSEVVGWVLIDDAARVLVRKDNGHVFLQAANPDDHDCIQTGAFATGNLLGNPAAHEIVG